MVPVARRRQMCESDEGGATGATAGLEGARTPRGPTGNHRARRGRLQRQGRGGQVVDRRRPGRDRAAMGWRTLAVDLDPQGNLGRDLGCRREGSSNHGRALLEAFRGRRPVTPLTGVRDGLDVVPTGARPSSTSGHSSPVSAAGHDLVARADTGSGGRPDGPGGRGPGRGPARGGPPPDRSRRSAGRVAVPQRSLSVSERARPGSANRACRRRPLGRCR